MEISRTPQRRTLRRWVRVIATSALAAVLWSGSLSPAVASYVASASVGTSVGTDVFTPPGALKVTTGCSLLPFLVSSTATISWTISPETYATGYRLTTNGTGTRDVAGRTTTSVKVNIAQNTNYTFTVMAFSANKWTSTNIGPSTAVSC